MGPAGSLCPAMATAHTLWRWWSPEIKAAGSQCRRQAPETVTCTLVSDTSAVTWESAVTVGSMSLQHHVPHAHRGRDCGSTAQSSACTACPLVTMGPCVPTSVLLSLAHSRNTSQPPSWLRSDVAPSSTLGSVAFLIHSLSPLLATCQRAQRGPQWGMAQPMGARTTARVPVRRPPGNSHSELLHTRGSTSVPGPSEDSFTRAAVPWDPLQKRPHGPGRSSRETRNTSLM